MKKINLLPKLKQQELVYERVFYSVTIAAIIATVLLLLGVAVQFLVRVYLDRQTHTIEVQIDQLKKTANKSENAAVKQQITLVNSQINDFANLSDQSPLWSNVLKAFLRNVPADVRITEFRGDATKKEITINGYSATRDTVIELYNNINTDKEHFKDINYPLENVAQPTDVQFTFTFTIVDTVLSKKPIPAPKAPAEEKPKSTEETK